MGSFVAGVDVDSPERHAKVVATLNLPFPILSDPDRSRAITPLGFSNSVDSRNIAVPATIVIDSNGDEVWRYVGRDQADRPLQEDVLDVLRGMKLDPVVQPLPVLRGSPPGSSLAR